MKKDTTVQERMRRYRERKQQGEVILPVRVNPLALGAALQEAFQKQITREDLPEATAKLLAEISSEETK